MTGRVFILAALVCLCAPRVHGQEDPARLDSIMPLLDPAKKDTLQLTMLIWVAESWTTSRNALPYLGRLDSLSNELLQHPNEQVRKRARHARGAYHFFTGYQAKFARNIPLALASFQQAIADFSVNDHRNALGECHDALGLVLRVVGELDEAEGHFMEELRIGRALDRPALKAQALTHLAGLHADRGQLDIAEAFLDSCGPSDHGDSALVLVERARIHGLREDPARQEAALLAALSIAGRSDNPWDELPVLTPLVRLLYADGRNEEGLRRAEECAALAKRMGDATAQCGCIMLAGEGLRRTGDLKAAEAMWLEGLALAEQNKNVGVARELGDEGSMLHASARLKDLYNAQGRSVDALRMTELWASLKDSVERMNGREALVMFQYHEKELLDSIAHAQLRGEEAVAHERELARERVQRYVVLGLCIIAVLVSMSLWNRFRFVRRTNAAILEAQTKLVESERAREASEVRTRIARDVHDQLGSDLTKLVLLSGEAKASLKDDPHDLPTIADDLERIAGEANRSLGDIVWAIDPHDDSLAGLTDRVRAHCERMLKWSHVTHSIDCVHEGPDRSLDPATKRDIYLIIREALNNAIKHAKAKHIGVIFHSSATDVRLVVEDDGVGVGSGEQRGHGMENMRHRAEHCGGLLDLESANGRGTRITFALQLPVPEHA